MAEYEIEKNSIKSKTTVAELKLEGTTAAWSKESKKNKKQKAATIEQSNTWVVTILGHSSAKVPIYPKQIKIKNKILGYREFSHKTAIAATKPLRYQECALTAPLFNS